MKKVFALMHKPSFLSLMPDTVVGIFESEEDALEALKIKKNKMRKPFVKSFDVFDTSDWKKEKEKPRRENRELLIDDDCFAPQHYGSDYMRYGRRG